jgi:hypothetical protein
MDRWGVWGGYQNECDQQYCSYEISIDDVSHAFHHFPFLDGGQWESELRWPEWLSRPYVWAGGRFSVVEAKFEVRDGLIWAKSFAVRTAFSPKAYRTQKNSYAAPDSNVIAEAFCTASFGFWRWMKGSESSVDNQEFHFSLTDNDREGHWDIAAFTPFADEGSVEAALNFDLSCITRRKECRTSSELMPMAASIPKTDTREAKRPQGGDFLKDLPPWVAARDAEYVAVAEVLAKTRQALTDRQALTFKVRKLLKGDTLVSMPSSVYMVRTEGAKGVCFVSDDVARNFRNETSVLLVFDEPLNQGSTPEPDTSPCAVYRLTDGNLAAVQRGISRYSTLYPAIRGSAP